MEANFSATLSIFLVEGGYVFTMGSNASGQRGVGHCNGVLETVSLVESIKDRYIVVGNKIYF